MTIEEFDCVLNQLQAIYPTRVTPEYRNMIKSSGFAKSFSEVDPKIFKRVLDNELSESKSFFPNLQHMLYSYAEAEEKIKKDIISFEWFILERVEDGVGIHTEIVDQWRGKLTEALSELSVSNQFVFIKCFISIYDYFRDKNRTIDILTDSLDAIISEAFEYAEKREPEYQTNLNRIIDETLAYAKNNSTSQICSISEYSPEQTSKLLKI